MASSPFPIPTPITVAHGDGIGPEIMAATLRILEAAGAQLKIDTIEVGEKVYLNGNTTGIAESSWDSLLRNKVFLKAPITTPQGGGMKSLNVTIRKTLGLYANVRPCVSYSPYVDTKHPKMDIVIVRENEEDLYAGIEHRQTEDSYQALKLITRSGTERIVRYAFEYCVRNSRKKLSCITKDNIMKLTDGTFHKVFDEVAKEYPQIQTDHHILDIAAARIADAPEQFDVVVTLNLYGDVISDIAAEIAGSVGLAGSANIGPDFAMFEAIHGSAPTIAGQGIANPSGLLLGAVMMLVHIGQADIATKVHNAWLRTIEDGVHTGEVFKEGISRRKVGTKDFADAVIARLGQEPEYFAKVNYSSFDQPNIVAKERPRSKKELIGLDLFFDYRGEASALAEKAQASAPDNMELMIVTSRGVKVWPDGFKATFQTDHFRCRFRGRNNGTITHNDIIELMKRVEMTGLDFIKMETLCSFDGVPGYSLAQGE
ncbi:MAG TPA: NADP-dependent isocitrate dehydrogenase [Candidatus Kapabacteria bacterium]|nr:NADP-dependent isocitrate dehydrogenase [Candidatus Kapabacteria bacterium]